MTTATPMYAHTLTLTHDRETIALLMGEVNTSSSVDIDAHSTDLTEAVCELLSRLPSDVYAALKAALEYQS